MYLDLECKIPYAYLDMGRLCVKGSSLHYINDTTDVVIPIGRVNTLFTGPGTTITHSAIKLCSWSGCTVMWVGEEISKCYSVSACQSRSSGNLLKQVHLYERKKSLIVKRYCIRRFGRVPVLGVISEERIRGFEGSKMKKTYIECALKYGIPYSGRHTYGEWTRQASYDKGISITNSFLYGVCCSVINALGYSTALGILHSGDQLSLVFDIADLYKTEYSIPIGFEMAKLYKDGTVTDAIFGRSLRKKVFEKFQKDKLLSIILKDIEDIFYDGDVHSTEHKEADQTGPFGLLL
jgi:CRISPR-associated protein Cas1